MRQCYRYRTQWKGYVAIKYPAFSFTVPPYVVPNVKL